MNGSSSLKVSADIEAGGRLTVQALDASGQVIAESEALTESVTDAGVKWQDDSVLEGIETARLQFVFHGATVYSLALT